jgi:arginine N-succinyltransferase
MSGAREVGRFRVRGALVDDLEALYELSGHLDTVNLPHDRRAIAATLERSRDTFEGRVDEAGDRLHVLVVEEIASGKPIGTSMVIGQLGTKRAPYVFFERGVEERYSRVLHRHFRHETLQIRYMYDGPTEIGGLVVHPALRAHPARLGRQIAFGRFALMAKWPLLFRPECVAELLPPRRPDGGSDFWDAVGRRFTGLDYGEADRLSRVEKEFIRELFPEAPIYLSLLSPEARFTVGRVGKETEPARAMLRSIGFREANRVDPFDGGPHFRARTERIDPVARARRTSLGDLGAEERTQPLLVAHFAPDPPWMVAVRLAPGEPIVRAREELDADADTAILAVPLAGG